MLSKEAPRSSVICLKYVQGCRLHRYVAQFTWIEDGGLLAKVAHPHIFICRAGIQNGSRDTGLSRAFLNGQFRLLKAKIGKKTNNFPLCCQLRLRTATEWLSRVSCAVLTLGSACHILICATAQPAADLVNYTDIIISRSQCQCRAGRERKI